MGEWTVEKEREKRSNTSVKNWLSLLLHHTLIEVHLPDERSILIIFMNLMT
uniref:Uncharacterized protein n=1 Tax=Rhizophora mucronata TaxID=61149 RepID=A0A2P2J0R9_RHIMU